MRYLVIGAAGHAQEVAWSLREQLNARKDDGELIFFDDGLATGPVASGLGMIVGGLDTVATHAAGMASRLVLGIGLPKVKRSVVERLSRLGVPWATVIHPQAIIGANVSIGEGSYVGAGAVITVNVRIGRFATVNMHCQVAHGDVLENFVTLHPDVHLSGNVTVREGAELGAGSIVIPGVDVGAWATLGAGCVAVKSLAGDHVYVGLPARPLERQPRARDRDSEIPTEHRRVR
jgi:sugar O-acyltransferase (sialic acid O-acetyltransferase NeuD family)